MVLRMPMRTRSAAASASSTAQVSRERRRCDAGVVMNISPEKRSDCDSKIASESIQISGIMRRELATTTSAQVDEDDGKVRRSHVYFVAWYRLTRKQKPRSRAGHIVSRDRVVGYCSRVMISCRTCFEGRVRSSGSVARGSSTRFSRSVKLGFCVST